MRVTRAELERLNQKRAEAGWTRLSPVLVGTQDALLLHEAEKEQRRRGTRLKARRKRGPRERETQREIITLLNATPGFHVWKAGAGLLPLADGRRVRMGKAGVADVVGYVVMHRAVGDLVRCARPPKRCLHPGHVPVWIAVEVKRARGGKPPTPLQLDFLARLREAGSPLAMVAYSADEVRRAVEAL